MERWLKGEPILARPMPVLEQALRWARRNPALAGASVLAVSCLTALAIGSTLATSRIAAAKEATEALLAHSQIREADRLFADARSAEGLALLAHVARKRPNDPDVARRLESALSHRRFPEPVYHQSPMIP